MYKRVKWLVGAGLLATLLSGVPTAPTQANPAQLSWTSVPTALKFDGCFDTMDPEYWWSNGTIYEWRTGKVAGSFWESIGGADAPSISPTLCGPGGWIYSSFGDSDIYPPQRTRFGQAKPDTLAHQVTDWSLDGSVRIYSLEKGVLRVSTDAGTTWGERRGPFSGEIKDIAVAAADSRVVYALVTNNIDDTQLSYTIYSSIDAGMSWQAGQTGTGRYDLMIATPQAVTASVNLVMVGSGASSVQYFDYTMLKLSNDRGRTWVAEAGKKETQGSYFVFTHEGIIRVTVERRCPCYSLELSVDGGSTWKPLATPPTRTELPRIPGTLSSIRLEANPWTPANLVLQDIDDTWYSADGGHSWNLIDEGVYSTYVDTRFEFAPAMPLLKISAHGSASALELNQAGKSSTLPVSNVNTPGGRYFPETGHNLSPLFLTYWDEHGGLAQFGYPKTEPLLEYNPADGNTYVVQYFERNRFEYHPELAGTHHEVLLGLLGKQLTAHRGNEAPFLPFNGDVRPDQRFFPETGHTLGTPFREYWERHGGLAIYGYPISEPFQEVNPDDGKTYTVQYFERARFEHHPELKGTPYEVLLGLLGNSLLREKGWQ